MPVCGNCNAISPSAAQKCVGCGTPFDGAHPTGVSTDRARAGSAQALERGSDLPKGRQLPIAILAVVGVVLTCVVVFLATRRGERGDSGTTQGRRTVSPLSEVEGRAPVSQDLPTGRGLPSADAVPQVSHSSGEQIQERSDPGLRGVEDLTSEITSATASSFLERHGPEHAVDGQSTTAWNEGAPSSGVGEWLEIRLSRRFRIAYLTVTPGWDRVSRTGLDLFTANRHMTQLEVRHDAGATVFDVPPGVRDYRAELGDLSLSWLRIVATRVDPAPVRWEDLCISEVRIFGRRE